MRCPWMLTLLLLGATLPVHADDHWPQFRGGPAGGVVDGKGFPDSWDTTKNVAWKAEVPGHGWSSPVVWGDRIFVTSVIRDGKYEEPKKGLYLGGERALSAEPHRWVVYCLDWKTGKILWEKLAHEGKPKTPIHVKNTYASETPVTDGERVYAYFGNIGLFCYDMDGKPLWSKDLGSHPMRFGWGTAASPVLYRDRLYVVHDNEEKSFLVALDKKIGEQVWRVERADEKSNWSTPFVWENEQRTELVTPGTGKVRSYDLDGKLLWELKGMSPITIPTPSARHGLLYVSSGHVLGNYWPMYAIRPGANGDITLKEGEAKNDFIVWSLKKAGPYHPSPLVYGDYVYVLYDRGFLACYDARTGKEVYDKQRLGTAAFTASPWAADGKIFCLSEEGETFVVQAGPEFKLLGKNILDGEMSMATPALARGSVVIRTLNKVYRIRSGQVGE